MASNPKPPSASLFARFTHISKAAIVAIAVTVIGTVLLAIPHKSEIVRDLGIALIPVGLIGLVYEIFLRETFISEMRAELSESLMAHFEAYGRLSNAGLIDVYETFPTTQIGKHFQQAKTIWILQTWIPDMITLVKPIQEAIINGSTVKILLLDPNSTLAQTRGQQLGYTDIQLAASNINNNLGELKRISHDPRIATQLEVRLYQVIPVACIHAYDDYMLVGSFLHGLPAIQGPQFLIHNNGSYLATAISNHFQGVWEISTPYLLNNQFASPANTTRVQ